MRSRTRRRSRAWLPWVVLVLGATAAVAAEEPIESHPGYFSLDELGIVDAESSSLDINLSGAMLRLVGAAVLQEEPELAELVSQMHAMRVLTSPVADLEEPKVIAALARGVKALEGRGWQRVVRVREDDEQVHVYLKEVEGRIEGLTLFVFDPADELTLINIAGRIDVDLLGALSQAFDVPTLERALEESPAPAAAPGKEPR